MSSCTLVPGRDEPLGRVRAEGATPAQVPDEAGQPAGVGVAEALDQGVRGHTE